MFFEKMNREEMKRNEKKRKCKVLTTYMHSARERYNSKGEQKTFESRKKSKITMSITFTIKVNELKAWLHTI